MPQKKKYDNQLSVPIDGDLKAWYQRLADEEGVPLALVIRRALLAYQAQIMAKKQAEPEPAFTIH